MVTFRDKLLKNWSSECWKFLLRNQFIIVSVKNVLPGYSFFRGDINIFMQPLFLYFVSALMFDYYIHKYFHFCF